MPIIYSGIVKSFSDRGDCRFGHAMLTSGDPDQLFGRLVFFFYDDGVYVHVEDGKYIWRDPYVYGENSGPRLFPDGAGLRWRRIAPPKVGDMLVFVLHDKAERHEHGVLPGLKAKPWAYASQVGDATKK